MDRRRFLKLSSFFSVSSPGLSAGLSACSGMTRPRPKPRRQLEVPAERGLGGPAPDSIVLWTRVSPSGVDDAASCRAARTSASAWW
jgi:phosphodiesterase/alkaline phosphatase D-like protein